MLIWLIRHGRTRCNEEGRYQGVLDTPLSEAGRRALRRADFIPERVYVSPLRRAAETAEILFPGAERISVPGLREMDFGAFEGRSFREMEHDPAYRAWVDGNCEGTCPGGESREAFARRTCAAFRALVDRALAEKYSRLVVVAHGGTQMAVLERYCRPARPFYEWMTDPGTGYVLDSALWPEALTLIERVRLSEER